LIQADASDRTRIEGAAGLPPDAGRSPGRGISYRPRRCRIRRRDRGNAQVHRPGRSATRGTAAHRGPAFFAYSVNYLVDADLAIIIDVEATTAIRQAEILVAKRMIERSIERFDLSPARLIGDTVWGRLDAQLARGGRAIEPHIPVFDKSQRTDDATFSRQHFTCDYASDTYHCPAGKSLHHYDR
jgi:hypothetical protein